MPGAFSAYGILVSDIRLNYTTGMLIPLGGAEGEIAQGVDELKSQAHEDLEKQGIAPEQAVFYPSLDIRYKGQSYDINCGLTSDITRNFHSMHRQLYGYAVSGEPLELVNVRLFVVYSRTKPLPEVGSGGKSTPFYTRRVVFDGGFVEANIYPRGDLAPDFSGTGPAIITEQTATTVIPPHAAFFVDRFGNIHVEVS